MKAPVLISFIVFAGALTLVAQQPALTNSIGMELVLIQPGTMQVGVFQPTCPDPNAPRGGGRPAGLGGPPQGSPSGAPNGPGRTPGGPGATRGGPGGMPGGSEAAPGGRAAGGGGGGRAPQDPRVAWSEADYKKCQELVKQDSSLGFKVEIKKPYYIGKYEVTQAQWKKVMGTNPSYFQGSKVTDDADKHPVDSVTWQQAQEFVKKLNQMEKTKAYRLPTEFEWEYAGRAGGPGQVPWADIRQTAVQGVSGFGFTAAMGAPAEPEPYPPTTKAVGTKKPNAWGLYDMLGNVWEWVQDPYNEKIFADPVPAKTGKEHVLKGCGFLSDVKNCIYATHGAGPADGWDVGFRIVKDVK